MQLACEQFRGIIVDEIFQTQASGKIVTCGGPIGGKYLSGKTKVVEGVTLFFKRSNEVKEKKKKCKNTSSSVKRRKCEAQLAKLSKTVKSQNKTCSYGPAGSPPASTPTPGGGGTQPQPTATPRSLGNFDSNGNVTAAGKVAFGIPSNLSANLNTGKNVFNTNCTGCHTEKTGRSFSFYKSAITVSPMFITHLSDQDIANLTAYLRRFELN